MASSFSCLLSGNHKLLQNAASLLFTYNSKQVTLALPELLNPVDKFGKIKYYNWWYGNWLIYTYAVLLDVDTNQIPA